MTAFTALTSSESSAIGSSGRRLLQSRSRDSLRFQTELELKSQSHVKAPYTHADPISGARFSVCVVESTRVNRRVSARSAAALIGTILKGSPSIGQIRL